MAAKDKKKKVAEEPEPLEGSSSRIRAVVERVKSLGDDLTIFDQVRRCTRG